jgi:hypothetical protein
MLSQGMVIQSTYVPDGSHGFSEALAKQSTSLVTQKYMVKYYFKKLL